MTDNKHSTDPKPNTKPKASPLKTAFIVLFWILIFAAIGLLALTGFVIFTCGL